MVENPPPWPLIRPAARVIGMSVMAVAAVAAILAVTVWQFAPTVVLSALLGLCLLMGAVFLLVERRTEAVWQTRLRRWIRHREGRER